MQAARTLLFTAVAVLVAVFSCGPSRKPPSSTDSCTGANCQKKDVPPQIKTTTIGELRHGDAIRFGTKVKVERVVVHTVAFLRKGTNGVTADFWVVDPESPTDGIWVEKFVADLPKDYEPKPGHVLNITAWYGTTSRYDERTGYRRVLKSEFDFNKGEGRLELEHVETTNKPAPNAAGDNFGNAEGGTKRPSIGLLGTLVHVPGPITLTNDKPEALARYDLTEGEKLEGYAGFEVTGGILVNNYRTYSRDGGLEDRCDWRLVAEKTGDQVVFPNGITGVWDTYTHAPCTKPPTDPDRDCFRATGYIPGFDAGYTHVLYPHSCDEIQATRQ